MNITLVVMVKNTDKQTIDKLSDNFRGYAALLRKIKQRVLIAQMLQQSQDADGWGKKTLQRLAGDLKNDYSEIKGFSVRNMQCMMQFFNEYNQELTMIKGGATSIAQPPVAQLGKYNFTLPIKHLDWTHNLIIMQQVKDIRARYWDYSKHGALANNFTETLPVPEANDVKSMLKDPYIFDMLTFTDQYNERDVEIGLVKHVEKFLVEMGAGFAFMGRQYHIEVSGDDYYIDILMYNAFLHRYLVIELKDTEFMPEYIGKLNFYCSAVDDILCREGDNRTIGLLLCKSKDRIKAEYALRDIQKPIGISDYELGQALPKDFRGSLPTVEEIEKELESE